MTSDLSFLQVCFDRSSHVQLNEEELIRDVLLREGRGRPNMLMFDVGANFGNSLDIYLGRGWSVVAFEPDPNNREVLLRYYEDIERLTIVPHAVALSDGQLLSFFGSSESTGISSLTPFTPGHREIAKVLTTRLDTFIDSQGIDFVDVLKIDVEGHDYFALQSFPLESLKPLAILVEYEDRKTLPLGYSVHDMASYLLSAGYEVWVSEWHPIIRYGIAHDWRRLTRYKASLSLESGWGNLIAFEKPVTEGVLSTLLSERIRFGPESSLGSSAHVHMKTAKAQVSLTRFAKRLVRILSRISPRFGGLAYRVLRRAKRLLKSII